MNWTFKREKYSGFFGLQGWANVIKVPIGLFSNMVQLYELSRQLSCPLNWFNMSSSDQTMNPVFTNFVRQSFSVWAVEKKILVKTLTQLGFFSHLWAAQKNVGENRICRFVFDLVVLKKPYKKVTFFWIISHFHEYTAHNANLDGIEFKIKLSRHSLDEWN